MKKNNSFVEGNSKILNHDIFKKYESLRITTSNPIETPIPVVSINENIISTKGNITTFSGESKSAKTSFCCVILAGAIRENKDSYYDGFDCLNISLNSQRKAVIHIDTEQAKHNHYRNQKRILKRLNIEKEPENFYSYNIRELYIKHRKQFITEIFENCNSLHNGIHVAVVDGIADFINSPNDESESNDIVDFFEKLAIKYDCPILVIIHLNPNSDKQRGFLGSQLQRKSESVLTIKKNGDVSYLEPKFLRSAGIGDIPKLQFEYCKIKDYHVSTGVYNKPDKEFEKQNELIVLAKEIFNTSVPLEYNTSTKRIMDLTGLKITAAKDRLKSMREFNIIVKNETGYLLVYPEPDSEKMPY